MNIALEVEAWVRRDPGAAALVEWDARGRERRLDFGGLGRDAAALSAGLAAAGVAKGDRVLLLVPMGIDLYLAILAVIRLGAVCVFADPYMGPKRFDACCASVRPKAFIGVPKGHLFRCFCPHLRQVPVKIATHGLFRPLALGMRTLIRRHRQGSQSFSAGTANASAATAAPAAYHPPAVVSADDPALISFTTGSSGSPKGSNRTHGFLRCQLQALDDPRKSACASDFPGFPILPLENLARGRVSYIPRLVPGKVREAGDTVVRQVQAWRPEMMSGSPAYLEAVADHALAAGIRLDSVKLLFTGGAPITAKALEKLARAWSEAEIAVVYGSTEAEPVSSMDAGEILRDCRPLSRRGLGFCVGYPVPSLKVVVLPMGFPGAGAVTTDPEAGALPAGEVGEITVMGPHVNTGYWDNAEGERENKIRAPGGIWHRMGDAGYFDARGRLWVVGRVHAAMANPHFRGEAADGQQGEPAPTSWAWLFPYQAECVVDEMPGIRKSAYLEAMGAHWLVAETADGRTENPELAEAIRKSLKDFPLAGVRFIDRLPVDPRHNSKVEYAKVKALLIAQAAQASQGARK